MDITCIVCPKGCRMKAEKAEDGSVTVVGNSCPRGEQYAVAEMTNPTRMLTTTVLTDDGGVISVKSDKPVPKDKILEIMSEINCTVGKTPLKIGDVLVHNIGGTGVNIIATKNSKEN